MQRTFAALLLVAAFASASTQIDCNRDEFSCHTCMAYDLYNCYDGQACCKTACFKVVDEANEIIAKGCWNDKHEPDPLKDVEPTDAHRRSYNLSDVKLAVFDENGLRKNVHGLGYFCKPEHKGGEWETDFCNSATLPTVNLVAVIMTAMAAMRLI